MEIVRSATLLEDMSVPNTRGGQQVKLTTASGLSYDTHDTYVVVLNLPRIEEQQSPYVFEGPAFEIWSRIDGSRTDEQIVDQLAEATGAERQVVARDTHEFLTHLLELGLIEETDEDSAV